MLSSIWVITIATPICINGVDVVEKQTLSQLHLSAEQARTMVLKVALVVALVGIAIADHYKHDDHYKHNDHGYHKEQYRHHHGYGHDDHYANIDYKFKYDVKDDKHYNYQSREEYKDGKNVYGSYSVVEPDGKVRIVKYKADDYGFQADVDYKGGYKQDYKPSYGHEEYKSSYGYH